MKIDGLTHPKTKELAFTLEIPLPHAIGLLELMWAFVAQQTPQGNIGKWSNAVISDAAGWSLDADKFVDALIQVRYLDRCQQHRLLVHDWPDHAPNWVHAKLKKQGKQFHIKKQSPILEPSKINQGTIPEATTSLAKPSLVKPSQEKSKDYAQSDESLQAEAILKIPLIDKSEFPITADQISDWQQDYPAINVEQEVRKCRQWNIANPKNRKTPAGIMRHINAWLSKAQDRAPTGNANGRQNTGTRKSAIQRQREAAERQAAEL